MFAEIDIGTLLKIAGTVVAIIFYFVSTKKPEPAPPEEWRPLPMDPESGRAGTATRTPQEEDWRKELNRLLREGRGAPPSVPPPVPPPLPSAAIPPPIPAPVDPYHAGHRWEHQTEDAPSLEHAPSLEDYQRPQEEVLPVAAAAYRQASTLDVRTAAHLQGLTQHHMAPATVTHVERAPGVGQALASLRQREGLRAALTAAIILGPPKSVDPRLPAG